MIEIKSEKASKKEGNRQVKGPIDIGQLQLATADHIDAVQQALKFFSLRLKLAGAIHDHTKHEYMDEFKTALESGQIKKSAWYKNHVREERHHLLENPPDDVNLIDVLEYISDCVMAGMARTGSVYDTTLSSNLLLKAYANTVDLLMGQVKLKEKEENKNE